MPLPADEILQPNCPIKPAWAVFDPVWYLKSYGHHLPPTTSITPAGLLAHYLKLGCRMGESPSPLFDERYYLSANPEIFALVKAGCYTSGFDHFCQLGHRSFTGHWLFDDSMYGNLYKDLSLETLSRNQIYGRYDHYLRCGQYEHRHPHILFDGGFYTNQAVAAGDNAGIIEDVGSYVHFLYRLSTNAAELPSSIYFDPNWYIETSGYLRAQDGNQRYSAAIQHYLRAPTVFRGDPVPEFSEEFYLRTNPDVALKTSSGSYYSGYQHFLQVGVFEFRRPTLSVNLAYYREANQSVCSDLNKGTIRDAFAHLRAIGLPSGIPYAPPNFGDATAKEFSVHKARINLTILARQKIDFSTHGQSQLSVVIVVSEKFELTMLALTGLRENYAGQLQLILVDNGSSDQTVEIEQYVAGARIIRLNRNIGYARACNLALEEISAEFVLFLKNDVELGFGAIKSAIDRMRSAPEIGAVGGKVICSNGLLQEAGCVIWSDGSTCNYMRNTEPLSGEANFVRDVDFCSRVFLLCRSSVVKDIGGFDGDFYSDPYEEADLCVRITSSGYRVVYDPAIVAHRQEYDSPAGGATQSLVVRGRNKFLRKHAIYLQGKLVNDPQNMTVARSPQVEQIKILFIEDTVPLHRLGSGYGRANDIVRAIAAAGYKVSLFPLNRTAFDFTRMASDLPDTVETFYQLDITLLCKFLESRYQYYDLIWISRTHNLGRALPHFLRGGIDPIRTPFVLDTEAIATLRDAGRTALSKDTSFNFDYELQIELELAKLCRHCVAVNQKEVELLRGAGLESVSLLGTMRSPSLTENGFSRREGILFVASIHQQDSPNLDALQWYLNEILPVLINKMANPPVLHIAGYIAPGIDLECFTDNLYIKLHGPVASLRSLYERCRLFIAPTRFAAGTPYKVYEAASLGLPCVTTALLALQLDWQDDVELLTAPVGDATRFAAQIMQLYCSPLIWERLRRNAIERITRENTVEKFNTSVAEILSSVLAKRCSTEPASQSGTAVQSALGHRVLV